MPMKFRITRTITAIPFCAQKIEIGYGTNTVYSLNKTGVRCQIGGRTSEFGQLRGHGGGQPHGGDVLLRKLPWDDMTFCEFCPNPRRKWDCGGIFFCTIYTVFLLNSHRYRHDLRRATSIYLSAPDSARSIQGFRRVFCFL
jgi:hypothetical protein